MEIEGEAGAGFEFQAIQVMTAQGEGPGTIPQATGAVGENRTEKFLGEPETEGAAKAIGGWGRQPEGLAGTKRKAADQDVEFQACRHENYRTSYRVRTTNGLTWIVEDPGGMRVGVLL